MRHLPEKPTPPGEMLQHFLDEMGLTQRQFATHVGWVQPKVNEVIRGKRRVTTETALVLADAFGTTPEFWLNLQAACDLREAMGRHKSVPRLPQAS